MFNTKDTYTLSTEQDAMEVKTQIQAHLKIFYQISATPRLTCLLQVRSHLEQLALDRTPVGKLRAESGWSRCWIIQKDQGFPPLLFTRWQQDLKINLQEMDPEEFTWQGRLCRSLTGVWIRWILFVGDCRLMFSHFYYYY